MTTFSENFGFHVASWFKRIKKCLKPSYNWLETRPRFDLCVFVINFEQIARIFPLSITLSLNMFRSVEWNIYLEVFSTIYNLSWVWEG